MKIKTLLRPSLDWLLLALPTAVILHYARPDEHVWIFAASCAAIIPLAGWMGRATEQLAHRVGEGLGGLLNATFGNAAELIIALVALRAGKFDIVKASLTGSIIGNVLLVLGASFLVGGLRHKQQRFNRTAASSQTTLLFLAAIALICPAAYHHVAGSEASVGDPKIGLAISGVLMATYAAGLVFSLITHRDSFSGHDAEAAKVQHANEKPWPTAVAAGVLVGVTALIAWVSEFLVGSVEQAAHTLGMSAVFTGVIVVAVIGNAAEHSTAILVAAKNRMDLSFHIAVGSSIQIALFVAPLLVFASHFIAPRPLDLAFTGVEVMAVFLAVLVVSQISSDGESNWMEGLLLLAVYLILGMLFYFLPTSATDPAAAVQLVPAV